MNDALDPDIRAALEIALSDTEHFAARLFLAARKRRARRLGIMCAGAATLAMAIAVGSGALAAGLLSNARSEQAICGVGLLLLLCAFFAAAESERLDDGLRASGASEALQNRQRNNRRTSNAGYAPAVDACVDACRFEAACDG